MTSVTIQELLENLTINPLIEIEPTMTLKPTLALLIGLPESIIFMQLHYWITKNKEAERNFYNGNFWTFNTYEDWKNSNFIFWSESTIKRAILRLEKGIIPTVHNHKLSKDPIPLIESSKKLNKKHRDQRKGYRVLYKNLIKIYNLYLKFILENKEIYPDLTNRLMKMFSYADIDIQINQSKFVDHQVNLTRSIRSNCTVPSGQIDPFHQVKLTQCINTESNTENISKNIPKKKKISSNTKIQNLKKSGTKEKKKSTLPFCNNQDIESLRPTFENILDLEKAYRKAIDNKIEHGINLAKKAITVLRKKSPAYDAFCSVRDVYRKYGGRKYKLLQETFSKYNLTAQKKLTKLIELDINPELYAKWIIETHRDFKNWGWFLCDGYLSDFDTAHSAKHKAETPESIILSKEEKLAKLKQFRRGH